MNEYKLKTPIVLGAETIEVLKLEEPNFDKLIEAEVELTPEALGSAKGMMNLIQACCTNVTEGHLRLMKFGDIPPAVEACTAFFS